MLRTEWYFHMGTDILILLHSRYLAQKLNAESIFYISANLFVRSGGLGHIYGIIDVVNYM